MSDPRVIEVCKNPDKLADVYELAKEYSEASMEGNEDRQFKLQGYITDAVMELWFEYLDEVDVWAPKETD